MEAKTEKGPRVRRREKPAPPKRQDIEAIPLEQLHASPRNPRRHVDDEDLADLAASLKAHGLLQPLVVRPRSAGGYELVCGHRRCAAARLAGLETLWCRVVDLDDVGALEAALVENSQRRDVPVLEEADALRDLVQLGADAEEVGMRLGHSRKWVRDRLALRELPDHFRQLLEAHRLPIRSAVAIARLPGARQTELAEEMPLHPQSWQRETWRHEQVAALINRVGRRLQQAPWNLDEEGVGERRACTLCPLRTDAQADLWGGTAADAACLDAACWASKLDGHAERLRAAGVTVITEPPEQYRTHRRLDEQSWELVREGGEARTWRELDPTIPSVVHLAPDGRATEYARTEHLEAALRSAGHVDAADDLQRVREPSLRTAPGESTPPRVIPSEEAMLAAVEQLVAWVEAQVHLVDLGALPLHLVALAALHARNTQPTIRRRGLDAATESADAESDAAVEDRVQGMSPPEQVGLLVEALTIGRALQAATKWGFPLEREDPFVALCRSAGVALPEGAVSAGDEGEQ